jgi:membrane dipeptidase
MSFPIIDLHSDLLSYLTHKDGRLPDDSLSRNSFPQMQAGNVAVQTLAIFSHTAERSVEQGKKQIDHFQHLLTAYLDRFTALTQQSNLSSPRVHLIAAFENASAFATSTEPLDIILSRLQKIQEKLGSLFYITLTWDGENRFGGGVGSPAGLKPDGGQLLTWLSNKRIAIDLSHTSDRFASDIIEYSDKKSLHIPLIASHSNFRSVTNRPRNLPDAIAKEIIRRKGLIGINLFAPFIHKSDPSVLIRHVEYGLSLGGENALCFGADFFCDTDFPMIKQKYPEAPFFFFEEYKNSSAYPYILASLEQRLGLSSEKLYAIANKNALDFLKKHIL